MEREYEKIFKRLADVRGDLDLTQEKVAYQIGVACGTYSKWERQLEIMPLERANKFCNIASCSMDYLIGLSDIRDCDYKVEEISREKAGLRLRKLRNSLDYTQKELAEELGTTQSVISGYETGKRLIKTPFIYDVVKKYHISFDWLCGRCDHPRIKQKIREKSD